ncbi:hypothetical protein ACWC0C_15275 [Streptomyces sp. NPDC001709]
MAHGLVDNADIPMEPRHDEAELAGRSPAFAVHTTGAPVSP